MSAIRINSYLANGGASSEHFGNFWDWFCEDEELESRGLALDEKVKQLVELGVLNADRDRVSYKNIMPGVGETFDIILVKSHDENGFWIVVSSGHQSTAGQAEFYTYATDENIEFKGGWDEMIEAIKTKGITAVTKLDQSMDTRV